MITWLKTIKDRNPGYSLAHNLWYELGWHGFRLIFTLLYDLRIHGSSRVPPTGGLIVIANHQTNLDPPMHAIATSRHLHFLAKVPLFTNPVFGAAIRAYNAIPLDQEKGDTAAIKAAINHLRQGRLVLIYPEGSRTLDGAMNNFKAGVALLIRRARVPVVPMAIEGAYDVWPRTRIRPRARGRIRVAVGDPISYEQLTASGDAQAMLDDLKDRIDRMRLVLRRRIRISTAGRWPRPGPGDLPHDHPDLPAQRYHDPWFAQE